MTCIVALKTNDAIYMGGDSAAVAGLSMTQTSEQKVFFLGSGKFLVGFAGSFRAGEIFRYGLTPPIHRKSKSDRQYMCIDFIRRLQDTLADHGFDSEEKDSKVKEVNSNFLVAYKNELYEIDSDYQVGVRLDPFNSIGCGSDIAKGSLDAILKHHIKSSLSPEEILISALQSSQKYSAGVREPFYINKILNKRK